ncbi:uncharacterized protein LOC27206385 [Drosophila simulans]|uniref:uncharacterized protein LOC27206385 n=1 Tax=Drosophila simulans TaxID=7240 RepID=UPI00078AE325|nr:uncharacterized protein LOC27206385 [Drosophila simulans]KMZ08367.1 uncharacterized protein Dsimw501_GD16753 [Drosophila simulans]
MFDRSLIPTGGASVSRVSTFTERHHRRVQLSRNKLYLQRLSRATSLVHKQPPLMNVKTQSGFDVLHEDARIFLERTNANVRLLLNLSKIKRTKGTIDFAEGPPVVPQSALPQMLRRLDRVQRHNLWLGLRLMRIHERKREGDQRKREGEKRTSEQSQSSNLRCSSVMTNRSALGENEVFNKYIGWDLEMPDEYLELIRLLRPRIVLHFGLMDGRPLGQVVVQLFTEAAPLVVLQFVRTCLGQRSHEFAVRRIFPRLWVEGYLLSSCKNSLGEASSLSYRDPMEFDTRVVSHARYGCVLSCAKEYCVHGFPGGAINFSISFKPLPVARGQRVGFGRVIRGDKVIEAMEAHGTKNGKISRPLLITHCELL